MVKKYRLALSFALFALLLIVVSVWYLHGRELAVLAPHGVIGLKERKLMLFTLILGAIVIIPVFIMTIAIAWRYRESNTTATYTPNWDSHRGAEITWWGIPILIIVILAVVTWISTYSLDPFKKLNSTATPLTVQVVALDWKWLFIYPDQHIASVNSFTFPANTPVTFQITADAPMNSFWIPQLGGQIYAMPGMSTQLNLMADRVGDYRGSSANISGKGFAGMHFIGHATTNHDFDAWVRATQKSSAVLNHSSYAKLAEPSQNNTTTVYGSVSDGLYDTIVMHYMSPMGDHTGTY